MRDGECTDEDIAETLALAEPRRFGYFRETDYVNVDEAMDILNLGYNRNLFYTLVKQYGIDIKTFNLVMNLKQILLQFCMKNINLM